MTYNLKKKFLNLLLLLQNSRGLHGPSLGIGAGIAIISIISAFYAINILDTSPELQFEGNSPPVTPIPTQQPTQPPGARIIQGLLDDDPVKGNPDATITIVEFSDFQCPFCQRFHQTTLPLILENYVDTGKVKFVYRDYPIQNLHPNGAISTALAAECADEQGKFWRRRSRFRNFFFKLYVISFFRIFHVIHKKLT